jgi:hypothetical protein
MDHFNAIGIIKNDPLYDEQKLNLFTDTIHTLREKAQWNRSELINLFNLMIPELSHKETGKFLDGRM